MTEFSNRHKVTIHYLLYNPSVIPWEIATPVERLPEIGENEVGCRVVPKALIDHLLETKPRIYSPSYDDIRETFGKKHRSNETDAGWRMEHFVCNLFISGAEGLVDDSPNFRAMTDLLSQKSSPISSALSITFDYQE